VGDYDHSDFLVIVPSIPFQLHQSNSIFDTMYSRME
jgi:hypothetical protein